jgi:hypothetical protein
METQNFWQQWIWRVPSLKEGAILTGFYSETIQEGYFIWSPVNLIYFQDTTNAKVGAEVLNEETIREIQMGNSFEKNFRSFDLDFDTVNLLVFSKPTPESCLRFLDHKQIELSIYDKILISNVSPYAKINPIEHTNTANKLMFKRLFGSESDELSWCFIYENASLTRQFGDWDEIINLHTLARENELKPFDPIEWFPFLQAYAYKGINDEVDQLVPIINETPYYRHQACSIFSQKEIDPDPAIQSGNQYLAESFCD